jgi:hypothetical protein
MTGAYSGSRLHARPSLQGGATHAAGASAHGTAGSKRPDCTPSPCLLPISPGSPLVRDDNPSQALLLWLLRYPLLRAEDLAVVTGYSRPRTYAQLVQLEAAEMVEAVRVPALGRPSAHLYHVSAVGMQELAHAYGDTIWRAARAWGADEAGLQRLLPRAPALVAVQTVVLSLIGGIGSASSVRAECPAPQQVGAQTEWAWERDYPFALTGQRGQRDPDTRPRGRSVRLDAYVRLRVRPSTDTTASTSPMSAAGRTENTTWYGLFVLYDEAFLDPGRPQATLRALLRTRQALEADGGTMPALLLLVPDAHRAQRWQALNVRMAVERWLARPLDGGILLAPPPWQNGDRASQQMRSGNEHSRSGLDAPNLWRANWLSLRDSGSCRLAALLTPARESTLPPLSTVSPVATSDDRHLARPSRAAKVIGHFNDRADRWAEPAPWRGALGESPTAGNRGGSDDGPGPCPGREHLALLALRLDARHASALALLAAHPLLGGEELAAVMAITSASAEVYLRHLRRLGLVMPATILRLPDRPAVPPDLRPLQGRYALSPLGIHLLAARCGRSCRGTPRAEGRASPWGDTHSAAYAREVVALMRVPAHTAGVYRFVASLHCAASAARAGGQAQRVVWWETGQACARQYRDVDGWHALRPDAAGEYVAGTRRLRFWLEWDRGTMGCRDLATKFAAYAHYVRSREWRADGNLPLPLLLIVTADAVGETRVTQALDESVPRSTSLAIRIAGASAVREHGPLAAIWRAWPLSAVPGAFSNRVPLGAPRSIPLLAEGIGAVTAP